MTGETVLVMGSTVATTWGRDQIRRLSEQARRRGLRLIGADTAANLAAAHPDELARVDETVELDVFDADACREWARGRSGIAAVLTIKELAVHPTAVLARELGLPGNDPAVVDRIRNKDETRERLREHGFPQPATAICTGPEDARRFLAEHPPGPWIVKPRDGLASIGVTCVAGADELPAALERFGAPPEAMGSLPGGAGGFLVETFVSGPEFSAEGVMVGGRPQVLALTRKEVVDGFIEIGHRQPAGLDAATTDEAVRAVSAAVLAVGMERGIFHVEFWRTDSGIVLGELHDRPGGDYIHALVEHLRPGYELYGALLDDLLGAPAQPVPPAHGAAAARFLAGPTGTLETVEGWNELTAHPSVLVAELFVEPGGRLEPVTDAFTRHGVFVVGGDAPDEVDQTVEKLDTGLRFVLRP